MVHLVMHDVQIVDNCGLSISFVMRIRPVLIPMLVSIIILYSYPILIPIVLYLIQYRYCILVMYSYQYYITVCISFLDHIRNSRIVHKWLISAILKNSSIGLTLTSSNSQMDIIYIIHVLYTYITYQVILYVISISILI